MIDYFNNHDQDVGDIYIIKLTNGVTLLSYLEFMDEDGEYFKLSHPYELMRNHGSSNEVTVGFFPWLYGAKESNTIVHSMDILTMTEASKEMIDTYRELIKGIQKANSKPLRHLDNLDFPFIDPWKNRMN